MAHMRHSQRRHNTMLGRNRTWLSSKPKFSTIATSASQADQLPNAILRNIRQGIYIISHPPVGTQNEDARQCLRRCLIFPSLQFWLPLSVEVDSKKFSVTVWLPYAATADQAVRTKRASASLPLERLASVSLSLQSVLT